MRQQVQRQLAKALMGLTLEFRKEETRFLNKVGEDPFLTLTITMLYILLLMASIPSLQVEAQKGLTAGSSLGFVESESNADFASVDPGFTQSQVSERVDDHESIYNGYFYRLLPLVAKYFILLSNLVKFVDRTSNYYGCHPTLMSHLILP